MSEKEDQEDYIKRVKEVIERVEKFDKEDLRKKITAIFKLIYKEYILINGVK